MDVDFVTFSLAQWCSPVVKFLLSYLNQVPVCKSLCSPFTRYRPRRRHLTNKIFHDSIPHDFFFETARVLVISLPTQGTVHFRQFLVTLLIYARQPHFYIEVTCNVEVPGTTFTTFTKYLNNTWDAILVHFQTLLRVWCIHCHHHGCSEENCCTSLFRLPWSLNCPELFWNQQRCETRLITITHISRKFQVRHISGLSLVNGDSGWRVRVWTSRPRQVFLYGRSVWWSFAIDFYWNQLRSVYLATKSEPKNATLSSAWVQSGFKESLTEMCTDSCNNIWLDSPSFFCKTFSLRSVFCSQSASHKEAYLKFTVDNVDFRLIPFYHFEAFVEYWMGLRQWLPSQAHLQSRGDFSSTQHWFHCWTTYWP